MRNPATSIIVITQPNVFGVVEERFAHTLQAMQSAQRYHLPQPEYPIFPHGTSSESVLRAIAHPAERLRPITHLLPEHARTLRDVSHRLRRSRGQLIIVGMLDDHSPFGSRRALEAVVRHFSQQPIEIAIVPLYWHITPSEFNRAQAELRHLTRPNVRVTDPFSVTDTYQTNFRTRLLDSLSDRKLSKQAWSDRDVVLIANHRAHGVTTLARIFEHTPRAYVTSLPSSFSLHDRFAQHLDRYLPVRISRVLPHHADLVTGDYKHPYLETLQFTSADDLLAVHLSPHFEASPSKPHRDILIVEESDTPEFDKLLASYTKSVHARPYYLCLVRPHKHTNLVFTNAVMDSSPAISYETLATIV